MALLGLLHDGAKACLLTLLPLADSVVRRLRKREPAVLRAVAGGVDAGNSGRLCLFAHFDRDHAVADYVVYHLRKLHELGHETVFVSTAERLDDASIERVRPYCREVVVRENIGYDFASWKVGLARAGDLDRYDSLTIANDSVYGPIRDMAGVFAGMAEGGFDFWGVTDSWRYSRHLQSYFVVFGRSVLQSPEFRAFWRELPYYAYKYSVIWNCEIGLSRLLLDQGFRMDVLCPSEDVRRGDTEPAAGGWSWLGFGRRINPSLRLWRRLLERHACPFIKVALLRDNPKRLSDVGDWAEVLGSVSDYDAELIRRHLGGSAPVSQG